MKSDIRLENLQPTINNSEIISNSQKPKPFNLEERLSLFSGEVLKYCNLFNKTTESQILISQFLRSATSIGANYIEACEALSKKDYLYRLRVSRKEAKEAIYWLKLLKQNYLQNPDKVKELLDEVIQLKNILSTIILNTEKKIRFKT